MSETAALTLTDFLLARIAEDEAEAGPNPPLIAWRAVYGNTRNRLESTHDGLMIAPERVLAECEAKRRIVERCRPRYAILYRESERLLAEAFDQLTMQTEAHSGPIWPFDGAEDILRALALPYADHPDYREEWRP